MPSTKIDNPHNNLLNLKQGTANVKLSNICMKKA